jgi:hypothetical protein
MTFHSLTSYHVGMLGTVISEPAQPPTFGRTIAPIMPQFTIVKL